MISTAKTAVPFVTSSKAEKLIVRRGATAAIASEAIGPIEPGISVFGVNKGQFSLIDIIQHCLAVTGPADVVISTWTAAGADMGFAYKLFTDGAIRSIRMIVDFSFPTRQPEYCAALRERFGDDALRLTKTHAKFVTITNENWNIVVRSSMNLNENKRLESFEITDSRDMREFLETLVDEIFEFQKAGEGFTNTPYKNCQDFDGLFGSDAGSMAIESTDTRKYFGNGRYSSDLRRTGRVCES